jgi:hypothetical protein
MNTPCPLVAWLLLVVATAFAFALLRCILLWRQPTPGVLAAALLAVSALHRKPFYEHVQCIRLCKLTLLLLLLRLLLLRARVSATALSLRQLSVVEFPASLLQDF